MTGLRIVNTNTGLNSWTFYAISSIGVLAVKAIQEQQREIDELRKEIAELKALVKKRVDISKAWIIPSL